MGERNDNSEKCRVSEVLEPDVRWNEKILFMMFILAIIVNDTVTNKNNDNCKGMLLSVATLFPFRESR